MARGALLGILGQVWHLATAFVLYAYLARQLGPAGFGQWRLTLSVLNWFEILLFAGLIKVSTKRLAEAPGELVKLTRASYFGQLLIGLVAFGALFVLAGPISILLREPRLALLLRVAALDIPVYALFMTASALLLGRHRYERQSFAWTVYATAKFAAIAGLVLFGFSVPGALIGNALASLVGLAAAFIPLPRDREAVSLAELTPLVGNLLVASIPFLALSLVEGLATSVDLWLVSAFVANAVAVGWYASAAVLGEIPTFIFTALERVLFPSVSGARADGDSALANRYALQSVRLAIIVTTIGIGIIIASGRIALHLLYSAEFAGAYIPLCILMVAGLGRTVRAICAQVQMARDQRKEALTILISSVILESVLLAVLASRWSVYGAAAAAAISGLIAGAWATIALRDMLGWRPLSTLVRSLAAAAVIGTGLHFVAQATATLSELPLVETAVYAVVILAAGVLYLGLLALIGEFDADDRASVRGIVARGRAGSSA
ncbi:MAG: oligosaccharide flippase family protein [Coriobacteriia bacterium]|nr:oligosaccharide flippase family protein [Coriobacteriia bacterium]